MLVKIKEEWFKKSSQFANEISQDKDRFSKADKLSGIVTRPRSHSLRQLLGKLGEQAVASILPGSSSPDFTVNESLQAFAPDLITADGYRIHVKTNDATKGTKFLRRALIAPSDPLIFSPHPKDILVIASVNKEAGEVNIVGAWFATDLVGQYRQSEGITWKKEIDEAWIPEGVFNWLKEFVRGAK